MNIENNKTRLCKTFLSLWCALLIIFLIFGSVTSVLGINFEESDNPNKSCLIIDRIPWAEKHLNQADEGVIRE